MLKMVARFPEPVDAHKSVLPLVQVKRVLARGPLGGAFFTPGHAALTLERQLARPGGPGRTCAAWPRYYVAVRGSGARPGPPVDLGRSDDRASGYELGDEDVVNLSTGWPASRRCCWRRAPRRSTRRSRACRPSQRASGDALARRAAAAQGARPHHRPRVLVVPDRRAQRPLCRRFVRPCRGDRNLYINDAACSPTRPA